MRLIVEVPDSIVEPVKDKLPPQGVLEAVALQAVVDYVVGLSSLSSAEPLTQSSRQPLRQLSPALRSIESSKDSCRSSPPHRTPRDH